MFDGMTESHKRSRIFSSLGFVHRDHRASFHKMGASFKKVILTPNSLKKLWRFQTASYLYIACGSMGLFCLCSGGSFISKPDDPELRPLLVFTQVHWNNNKHVGSKRSCSIE